MDDKDSAYFGCWFDKNMIPHTLSVKTDLHRNFLRITPVEGDLLEFDQISVI